jgi:hypothetical protein
MAMSRCIIQVEPGMLARIDSMAAERERSRAWMVRELLLRQLSVAQPVSADHPFIPRAGNVLRCDGCGLRKAEH